MGKFFRLAIPAPSMICRFSTISLHYHIPDAFGAAESTRISNKLGHGKPQASAAIFGARSEMGYAFSYEKEVVDYVNQISPLLSLCALMHSFEAVLSGIARGNGW
ncbi:hypothetical protein CDL12_11234 [Handroanthus impetiginosus]|uniref:Uncharacterized protein n=1 Tax=Handroanthus impetiginosus TaxID=429701 RepID=A0A2G9HF22_9LAMI|nr:hypothetical protein CDL12_11234 [Handroanthus impetiginosus]